MADAEILTFFDVAVLASIGNVSARTPAHDQAQCIGDNPNRIQERMGQCRAAKKSEKAITVDFHGLSAHVESVSI